MSPFRMHTIEHALLSLAVSFGSRISGLFRNSGQSQTNRAYYEAKSLFYPYHRHSTTQGAGNEGLSDMHHPVSGPPDAGIQNQAEFSSSAPHFLSPRRTTQLT